VRNPTGTQRSVDDQYHRRPFSNNSVTIQLLFRFELEGVHIHFTLTLAPRGTGRLDDNSPAVEEQVKF
jgi:hypothetical protein